MTAEHYERVLTKSLGIAVYEFIRCHDKSGDIGLKVKDVLLVVHIGERTTTGYKINSTWFSIPYRIQSSR